MDHLESDHNVDKSPGAASHRVIQLASALFNRDQVMQGDGLVLGRSSGRGEYLQRSSKLISNWVEKEGVHFDRFRKGGIAKIDRHIRLCLTRGCPIYCLKEVVIGGGYRKRWYIYYTEDFAELLMGVAIRPDVKGAPNVIRGKILQTFLIDGRESAFLLPSKQDTILFTMDDIMANSSARLVRDRCVRYLSEQGEFEIPRHDGTYKMLMSRTRQPKHGSQIRKYEDKSALLGRKDRLHVAHALITASGATITASTAFSENRGISIDVVKRGFPPPTGSHRTQDMCGYRILIDRVILARKTHGGAAWPGRHHLRPATPLPRN